MTTILSTARAARARQAQCAMSGVHASFALMPFVAVGPAPALAPWDGSVFTTPASTTPASTTPARAAIARITPPFAALFFDVSDGAVLGAVKDDPGLRSSRPPV